MDRVSGFYPEDAGSTPARGAIKRAMRYSAYRAKSELRNRVRRAQEREFMQRIETQQELLLFAVQRYNHYNKIYQEAHGSSISVYYLKDFLNDLLLIQRFASKDDSISGEGRETGSADMS